MSWNHVKWHDCPFFSFSEMKSLCCDSCQGCPCPYSGIPGGAAGSPACPSPLHHHTAGTCPIRERCPRLPGVSQPNPAVPRYSWERQTGPWSPPRERLLAAQFELLIWAAAPAPIRWWGWDCHHKMLHFASLAFGPKLTKCRGKSSAFPDVWIRLPTFNIK